MLENIASPEGVQPNAPVEQQPEAEIMSDIVKNVLSKYSGEDKSSVEPHLREIQNILTQNENTIKNLEKEAYESKEAIRKIKENKDEILNEKKKMKESMPKEEEIQSLKDKAATIGQLEKEISELNNKLKEERTLRETELINSKINDEISACLKEHKSKSAFNDFLNYELKKVVNYDKETKSLKLKDPGGGSMRINYKDASISDYVESLKKGRYKECFESNIPDTGLNSDIGSEKGFHPDRTSSDGIFTFN